MLVLMQLQFNIDLNEDNEFIHKAHGADDGSVVINRFILWVPKLTPKDSVYNEFVSKFMKETHWRRRRCMSHQLRLNLRFLSDKCQC